MELTAGEALRTLETEVKCWKGYAGKSRQGGSQARDGDENVGAVCKWETTAWLAWIRKGREVVKSKMGRKEGRGHKYMCDGKVGVEERKEKEERKQGAR